MCTVPRAGHDPISRSASCRTGKAIACMTWPCGGLQKKITDAPCATPSNSTSPRFRFYPPNPAYGRTAPFLPSSSHHAVPGLPAGGLVGAPWPARSAYGRGTEGPDGGGGWGRCSTGWTGGRYRLGLFKCVQGGAFCVLGECGGFPMLSGNFVGLVDWI